MQPKPDSANKGGIFGSGNLNLGNQKTDPNPKPAGDTKPVGNLFTNPQKPSGDSKPVGSLFNNPQKPGGDTKPGGSLFNNPQMPAGDSKPAGGLFTNASGGSKTDGGPNNNLFGGGTLGKPMTDPK